MNGKLAWYTYLTIGVKYLFAFLTTTFLVYMFLQMYFWFNPKPEPFWFFTIFNQEVVEDSDFSKSLEEFRKEKKR